MAKIVIRLIEWGERLSAGLKSNLMTTVMTALFLIGMLYGSLLICMGEAELLDTLQQMVQGYLAGRTAQSFWRTLLYSLYSVGGYLLVLFLSGFSAVSTPLILVSPLFKGMGLGVSIGYLYTTCGWKGVAFCAALILPAAVFSTFAVIFSAKESFWLSVRFLSGVVPRISRKISGYAVKRYCVRYLVWSLCALFSVLVDAGTTFLFADFFV